MDPLLTSLCGICHTQEPKYKCPRCGARTCSLPCVKKHKKWSSCNGERDPTVFIPSSKLRTDAGIDHDYNFLTKIERSLEQTQKFLIDERGILPQRTQQNDRSHGPPNKRTRLNKGNSRGRTILEGGTRSWARPTLGRLNSLGIKVIHQTYGMFRAKNNTTSYNKRTQTVNWQVEWCILDPASSSAENTFLRPERLLNKMLDSTPIYIGYADCREQHRRSLMSKKEKELEKKQKEEQIEAAVEEDKHGNFCFAGQNWESSSWAAAAITFQKPNGCWRTSTQGKWGTPSGRHLRTEHAKENYQFYLHIPGTPSREPQKLIAVSADDNLASILSGIEVLEFPSIYVTPAGMRLPQGYRLEKRPTNSPTNNTSPKASWLPQKRKSEVLVAYDTSEEEGEIAEANSDEEMESDNDDLESDDDTELMESAIGVVEDDTTSSSGSDSDEEME